MGGNQNNTWQGIARAEINWHPTVVADRCLGCGLCVTSCGRGVYAFDYELNKPVVVAPQMCMVGCTTCATLCPNEAILLPGRAAIQQTIAQGSLADRTRKELRAYRKRYGGRMPQPIDPGDLDERQRAN